MSFNLQQQIAISKGISMDVTLEESNEDEQKELRNYMSKISVTQGYLKSLVNNTEKLESLKGHLQGAVLGDKVKCIDFLYFD